MGEKSPCRAARGIHAYAEERASMIHLDTSFLIHAMVPSSRADKSLRKWLRDEEDLAISSIAWAEFLCGPVERSEIDAGPEIGPGP